jgi:hypothetical protein
MTPQALPKATLVACGRWPSDTTVLDIPDAGSQEKALWLTSKFPDYGAHDIFPCYVLIRTIFNIINNHSLNSFNQARMLQR